jgi:hypothetical protein
MVLHDPSGPGDRVRDHRRIALRGGTEQLASERRSKHEWLELQHPIPEPQNCQDQL